MWTQENAEGFTQAELDTMNEVLERLTVDTEADPANINDALNNAFVPGITADELYAAVAPRFA